MGLRVSSPGVGWLGGERRRRFGWWALGGSGLTALLSWALMIPLDSPGLFLLSAVAGIAAVVSGIVITTARASAGHRGPGHVEVEGDVLKVHSAAGARQVALADIEAGWLEHPSEVRFRLRDRTVLAVTAPDVPTAEALLAAAGVGAEQRILSVPLASLASQSAGGVPIAVAGIVLLSPVLLFMAAVLSLGLRDVLSQPSLAGMIAMTGFAVFAAVLAVAMAAIVGSLRQREAVVGADGVTLRQGRRRTFVPYARMVGVAPYARGVRLQRADGPPVLLATARHSDASLDGPLAAADTSDAALRQRVLVDRIGRAARASRRGSADLHELDRRGRSIAEWRVDVQALARAKTDYRSTGLTSADLADVVEDVVAPPEPKQRVRVVIETCADEELRAALEQSAEAELEEEIAQRVLLRR
jgi:hypothetical protein